MVEGQGHRPKFMARIRARVRLGNAHCAKAVGATQSEGVSN